MGRVRYVEDLRPELQCPRPVQFELPEHTQIEIDEARPAHAVKPCVAKPPLGDRAEGGRIEPGPTRSDSAQDVDLRLDLVGHLIVPGRSSEVPAEVTVKGLPE